MLITTLFQIDTPKFHDVTAGSHSEAQIIVNNCCTFSCLRLVFGASLSLVVYISVLWICTVLMLMPKLIKYLYFGFSVNKEGKRHYFGMHSGSRKQLRFVETFIRNSDLIKIILTSTFTGKNISIIRQNIVPIKTRYSHLKRSQAQCANYTLSTVRFYIFMHLFHEYLVS